jgi:hypothetical protein
MAYYSVVEELSVFGLRLTLRCRGAEQFRRDMRITDESIFKRTDQTDALYVATRSLTFYSAG